MLVRVLSICIQHVRGCASMLFVLALGCAVIYPCGARFSLLVIYPRGARFSLLTAFTSCKGKYISCIISNQYGVESNPCIAYFHLNGYGTFINLPINHFMILCWVYTLHKKTWEAWIHFLATWAFWSAALAGQIESAWSLMYKAMNGLDSSSEVIGGAGMV